ncbi:MAG: hemolysin family protein [Pseudomonadota bacterium]
MGDNDGSSEAARGAPTDEGIPSQSFTTSSQGGFFSRMMGALAAPNGVNGESDPPALLEATSSRGIANLRHMRVDDVSIPKADIVAVPVSADMDELVRVFKESGLTRLPVYDGTLDTPVGLAHLKDLALEHGFNGRPARFDLADLVRPLLFVPPSMGIGVLLTKMQTERRHMALVIDEYGGVDGLVTIEDLIEQVIGEIEDEHDVEEATFWSVEKSGVYLALAKTPLGEFEAEVGTSLTDHDDVDEEDIDTLGGLVFKLSGRVPARGEVVPHPDGHEFEVIDADARRIKRLRVRLKGISV